MTAFGEEFSILSQPHCWEERSAASFLAAVFYAFDSYEQLVGAGGGGGGWVK